MVTWKFRDEYGIAQMVCVKAYYVPTSNVQLFSPQYYFAKEKQGSFLLISQGCIFNFASRGQLSFGYENRSSLTVALAELKVKEKSGIASYLAAASTQRLNVSKS